jgi:hypothetical protein
LCFGYLAKPISNAERAFVPIPIVLKLSILIAGRAAKSNVRERL